MARGRPRQCAHQLRQRHQDDASEWQFTTRRGTKAMRNAKARDVVSAGSANLKIYINGRMVPIEEATISVFDSGLNFADGVFEGVRVYAGAVFRLDRHLKRMFHSARAFEID